jgi:HEAT repeat protein
LLGQSDQTGQAPIEDDLFHTNLILAGRCLAARPTVRQIALREEVIARLFDLLQSTSYDLTREQAAQALAEIGGQTVNEQLLGLLTNERVNKYERMSIAEALGALGERSVVPQLLGLLANERVNVSVRRSIAGALASLIDKEEDVQSLANLLIDSDITDSIYRALWTASRRVGVRVLVRNESGKERLEVVRR